MLRNTVARWMLLTSILSILLAIISNSLKSFYSGETYNVEIVAGYLQLLGNSLVFLAYTRGVFFFVDWRARTFAFVGCIPPIAFATITVYNVLWPQYLSFFS